VPSGQSSAAAMSLEGGLGEKPQLHHRAMLLRQARHGGAQAGGVVRPPGRARTGLRFRVRHLIRPGVAEGKRRTAVRPAHRFEKPVPQDAVHPGGERAAAVEAGATISTPRPGSPGPGPPPPGRPGTSPARCATAARAALPTRAPNASTAARAGEGEEVLRVGGRRRGHGACFP
jgi:hypothetical protein